ncbi:MAG: aminoglycoside phosphotransferase family protein [Pyrinomonadaceae bacterium]|nr:aminoglycoside phosphotransferase family protein [Pyrinomonadaceae bacterium]
MAELQMPEKWDADRELTGEMVRAALQEALPASESLSLEYLGSGWDFDAYLANKTYVARFPRRKAVAENLPREVTISETVRELVGSAFELPCLEIRGKDQTHFHYPFLLQNYIPGVDLDELEHPSDELARDLGKALGILHGVPVSIDRDGFFGRDIRDCMESFDDVLKKAAEDRALETTIPEAYEWLGGFPDIPDDYTGPERFIHDDLCADHIIVNPETGKLLGIIDWSDAAFGDPVLDFIVFVMSYGYEFCDSVLENYELDVDTGFRERLEFFAKTLSIEWFFEDVKRNKDLAKHSVWVKNAFRLV